MNFSILRWSVLLLLIIDGLTTDDSSAVNVLKTLNTNYSTCDLRSFIKPLDINKDEATVFIDDLTTYCSNTPSTSRLLCRVLLIELEIACSLPTNTRPVPVLYTTVRTAAELCSASRTAFTNSWIWTKLTTNEKEQIGAAPSDLCDKITRSNETLRLAQFFYKIATKIRRSETFNATSSVNKTSVDTVGGKLSNIVERNQSAPSVEQVNKLSVNNKSSETIQENRTVLNLQGQKVDIRDPNQRRVDVETGEANNVKPPPNAGEVRGQPIKKSEVAVKLENEKNEGMPLGRAGEKPEREQVNERPKPRVVEVESVFKLNERDKGHWVEGKVGVIPHEKNVDEDLNQPDQMKPEDTLLAVAPQSSKRRAPFRLKLSRYRDGNDTNWLADLTTFFLVFTLCVVGIYLVLRGKNKILGLIIEGCRRRRSLSGHRPTGATNPPRHSRLSQSS